MKDDITAIYSNINNAVSDKGHSKRETLHTHQ